MGLFVPGCSQIMKTERNKTFWMIVKKVAFLACCADKGHR